jgi:Protein of unknown function (DUF1353)
MSEHEVGRFTGRLVLEPLPGSQHMKTLLDFGFLDADGRKWLVPSGTSLDGASIPIGLWSWFGGLWEGKYLEACVVHDYHCANRSADWQSIRRMFYHAMRASGITQLFAKLVFAGVYFAGPRWEDVGSERVVQRAILIQGAPGDILYSLCRDPTTLAVSEAIECEGTSAFDWITSAHRRDNRSSEITLRLDRLSDMVKEEAPSVRNLEMAIEYAVGLIPAGDESPRRVSVGPAMVRD